jgi:hypothetical protein
LEKAPAVDTGAARRVVDGAADEVVDGAIRGIGRSGDELTVRDRAGRQRKVGALVVAAAQAARERADPSHDGEG